MESDWSRRRVYRARTMRRRRRLLAVLVALAAVAVGLAVAHDRATGSGRVVYDRAAAAAYADRWALSADPACWTSNDHDCANFVSQCVAAGGLRPIDGPAGTWRSAGRGVPSIGWLNCDAQQRVWSSSAETGGPFIAQAGSRQPAAWATGDVVYLGNTVGGVAEWQHVIICVGKRGGAWVYDSHTVAHRRKTLATWYPAHFSLIRFCHLADEVPYR